MVVGLIVMYGIDLEFYESGLEGRFDFVYVKMVVVDYLFV